MSQDTISETAEKICRALVGDARKVDCDIIESHIREMIVTHPSDSAETRGPAKKDWLNGWREAIEQLPVSRDAAPAATRAQGAGTLTTELIRKISAFYDPNVRNFVMSGLEQARAILAAPAQGEQDGESLTQEGDKRLMDMLMQAFGTSHQAIDDLAALILRANAICRDVARYRWLEKRCENGLGLSYGAHSDAVRAWFVRFPVLESGVGMPLGEAIDAAMKGEKA